MIYSDFHAYLASMWSAYTNEQMDSYKGLQAYNWMGEGESSQRDKTPRIITLRLTGLLCGKNVVLFPSLYWICLFFYQYPSYPPSILFAWII